MKILILLLCSSCSLFKYSPIEARRRVILDCVNDFTEQEIDVYKAYKVCKDLYKRRYK